MNPPRTLPIRLSPLQGEALDSWLEAVAHRLAIPLNDLMQALGLPGGAHRRSKRPGTADRTIALLSAEACAIAAATGQCEGRVHAMTLARYDQRAVVLDPATRLVNIRTLWGRGKGSRYCPDCLAATSGRWQLRWRLNWSVACVTHQRLLADDCPGCGRPQRQRSSAQHDPPDPGHCENPVHPADHSPVRGHGAHVRCGTTLSRAATLQLPAGHPVLRAQQLLDELIEASTASFGVYAASPQPVITALADFRAIAGRAIAIAQGTELDLSAMQPSDPLTTRIRLMARDQHQRANAPAQVRPGTMAPPDVFCAAAGLTAAVEVLTASDVQEAAGTLRWLITAPRAAGRIPSPSTIDDWGRNTSRVLRVVQLAALGPQLRPTDQLRYRTTSATPREVDAGTAAQQRAARIPALIWLPWLVRICPPAGIHARIARPALSCALLLPGTRLNLSEVASLLGSESSANDLSKTVQLLHDSPYWPDIAEALVRLAGHLDDYGAPIDYQRRRRLDYGGLLPGSEWQEICRQAHAPPQSGTWDAVARCVQYELISGSPARTSPFWPSDGIYGFQRRMAEFSAVRTAEVGRRFRESANEFLTRQGIDDEPVSWEPPQFLLDGLTLPGPGPDSISPDHVHQLIRGERLDVTVAARRLGVIREAVQLILAGHPAPPDGRPLRALGERTRAPRAAISRDWLYRQHVTAGRSLSDLARETGLAKSTIRRWANAWAVPVQRRYPIRMNVTAAAAAAPRILRPAITGPRAWNRLRRLAEASRYPSLSQAAASLGISHTALIVQVGRLEREFGRRLLERAPGQSAMRPTAYGQEVISAVLAAERRTRK